MADQAIVIIHGMGEQRPMDFLRGFVDAALPVGSTVFSQPDPESESLELRRLRALTSPTRPPTYLYEYYWAHQLQGNTLRDLGPLTRRFFLTLPTRVPGSLRFIYYLVWILSVYLGARLLAFMGNEFDTGPETITDFISDFGLGPFGVWAALALLGVTQGFLVSYFGDVARYLDPKPGNVAIRQAIRSEALTLLDRITKRHDRVIVVAHSLGSIIALDVLGHLWADYYYEHRTDPVAQPALDALEAVGAQLEGDPSKAGEYRTAQRALWQEQREVLRNPWRISDFISVGSPLTHAKLLLTSRKLGIAELQELRELPRCPPVDDTTGGYSYTPGDPRGPRRLHHGAHFAFVRWTNLWFPSRLGVFGDWFAGPVGAVFGPGVADVPVRNGARGLVPLLAHTYYFSGGDKDASPAPQSSIGALRAALDLDSKSWL